MMMHHFHSSIKGSMSLLFRVDVLSDLQDGKSVGSLILGPDGEIIQLSLYDNSQDPSQGDDGTQQQGTIRPKSAQFTQRRDIHSN